MGDTVCKNRTFDEEYKFLCNLPLDFGNLVCVFREWQGISQEKLAERLSVSYKTVQRIEAGSKPNPSLGMVVMMCVALELPALYSDYFVRQCRYSGFNIFDNEETYLYMKIINSDDKKTIEYWNAILEQKNCTQLHLD